MKKNPNKVRESYQIILSETLPESEGYVRLVYSVIRDEGCDANPGLGACKNCPLPECIMDSIPDYDE